MMSNVPTPSGNLCKLRALELADAPSLAKHANDVDVWRNLFEGFPHPYALSDAEIWCVEGSHDPGFGFVWGIVVDDTVVGCCAVRPESAGQACNAEVGYWIGKAYWGRGISADALVAITQWAWLSLPQVQRLYAPIYSRNIASQRVAQKAGYVLEAHIPRSIVKAGEVLDMSQYACYRKI